MGGIRVFRHERYSVKATLFTYEEGIYSNEGYTENRFRRTSEKEIRT